MFFWFWPAAMVLSPQSPSTSKVNAPLAGSVLNRGAASAAEQVGRRGAAGVDPVAVAGAGSQPGDPDRGLVLDGAARR